MGEQRVDWLTMAGWGLILMPLLTMWHEIGGHAAACAAQGGHVAAIGAFYVQCRGLARPAAVLVACAGVIVNMLLALAVWMLWRRARDDARRVPLWLVWVSEGFVAAGYLCFSGVTGVGDLGTGAHGALSTVPYPAILRIVEIVVGIGAYAWLVRTAIRGLDAMIGTGISTRRARRHIAHSYYTAAGIGAVVVGLMNPVGWFITIMSAAASSFGGLAGFISIGFSAKGEDAARPIVVPRDWRVIGGGIVTLAAFAVLLGPTQRF